MAALHINLLTYSTIREQIRHEKRLLTSTKQRYSKIIRQIAKQLRRHPNESEQIRNTNCDLNQQINQGKKKHTVN